MDTKPDPETAIGSVVAAVSEVIGTYKEAMKDGKLGVRDKLKLFSAVLDQSDALGQISEIDDEMKAAMRSPAVLRELLADVEEAAPETGTKLEDRLEALADFLPHVLTFTLRWQGKPLDVAPVGAEMPPPDLIQFPWGSYKRKGLSEMRPYVGGEDLSGVSISEADKANGSPLAGDMIARNPQNHADQWLVAAKYFADNLEPA